MEQKSIEYNIKSEPKKSAIKKFWDWFWKGDSLSSWIFSILLAFVLVKFVFFPGLSLILATPLPLVVVESSSMHHDGDLLKDITGFAISGSVFDTFWNSHSEWYVQRGISKNEFSAWPFVDGFDKGDIVVIYGHSEPKIGDVIVFNANQAHPIIHRVINIAENGEKTYSTKGDNNLDQLPVEKQIQKNIVIGKAIFRIPKIGWVKLFFVDIINALSGK